MLILLLRKYSMSSALSKSMDTYVNKMINKIKTDHGYNKGFKIHDYVFTLFANISSTLTYGKRYLTLKQNYLHFFR